LKIILPPRVLTIGTCSQDDCQDDWQEHWGSASAHVPGGQQNVRTRARADRLRDRLSDVAIRRLNVDLEAPEHHRWSDEFAPDLCFRDETIGGTPMSSPTLDLNCLFMPPARSLNSLLMIGPFPRFPDNPATMTDTKTLVPPPTPIPTLPREGPAPSRRVVVAVDWGTSESGIAQAIRPPNNTCTPTNMPPIYISAPLPTPTTTTAPTTSATAKKVVTAVLMSPGGKLLAFGPEALRLYDEMAETRARSGDQRGRILATDPMLFESTKMRLFSQQVRRDTTVTARCGRSSLLLDLLTEVLRHKADSARAHLNSVLSASGQKERLDADDIDFMVTVPAIFSHAAKQLMLEAAARANLKHVNLALESEAAAVACHHFVLTELATKGSKGSLGAEYAHYLAPGTKVLILDLGGGSADLAVAQALPDGKLGQISHSGNAWGSRTVNEEIETLLDRTFGATFMHLYSIQFPADYRVLQNAINTLKEEIDPVRPDDYRMDLPLSFLVQTKLAQYSTNKKGVVVELDSAADPHGTRATSAPAEAQVAPVPSTIVVGPVEASASTTEGTDDKKDSDDWGVNAVDEGLMEEAKAASRCKVKELGMATSMAAMNWTQPPTSRVWFVNGALRFHRLMALEWNRKVLTPLLQHTGKLLTEHPSVSVVMAVGGFSNSEDLKVQLQRLIAERNAIRKEAKLTPILYVSPPKPQLSVLIGAVMLGLTPDIVRSRIFRYHIGRDTTVAYNAPGHKLTAGCEKVPRTLVMGNGKLVSDPICHDHFMVLVKAGTVMQADAEVSCICPPTYGYQRNMKIRLFTADGDKSPPVRVDCTSADGIEAAQCLGTVTVDMPIDDGGTGRTVKLNLKFGGTHIRASATDAISGTQTNAILSFLG
jgi:hypothetical protein